MKRKLLSLIIAVSTVLTACGSTETTVEKEQPVIEEATTVETVSEELSTEDNSTTAAISVDENLFTVEITVAKEWLGEDVTQESLDLNVTENGFESATLNADGSVTYKMSKKKHNEFLEEMKKTTEESCNNLINGEDAIESFEKITFNDDLTKFDIYVDKETFSDWDTFSTLVFYMCGGYYQAFNGVAGDDIDVEVNYIDNDTNDILESGKLSDSGESSTAKSSSQDASEVSVDDMLFEIENWYIGDIWNNIVDFNTYRLTGKDCTGSDIDIEFAYDTFKESYALKEEYSTYISSLSDEYADLKEVWTKMNEQIELIYTDLETNGLTQSGTGLNTDLLSQYSQTFYNCID